VTGAEARRLARDERADLYDDLGGRMTG